MAWRNRLIEILLFSMLILSGGGLVFAQGWIQPPAPAPAGNWASAPRPVWQRYVEPSHGTTITLPGAMLSVSERTAGGAVFRGGPAKLEVSAKIVPGVKSSSDLRIFIARASGYERVDYMPSGANWLVVSGYRGPMILL